MEWLRNYWDDVYHVSFNIFVQNPSFKTWFMVRKLVMEIINEFDGQYDKNNPLLEINQLKDLWSSYSSCLSRCLKCIDLLINDSGFELFSKLSEADSISLFSLLTQKLVVARKLTDKANKASLQLLALWICRKGK